MVEKSYVPDSGGPGRHRGGLGQVVVTRKLFDDGKPALAGLYPIGVGLGVEGLFKGRPGGSAHAAVLDAKGEELTDIGVGALVSLSSPDEIVELRLAGGSGYGDPLQRPLEEVQWDLDGGYVTAEGAARDYGCVIGPGGRIDVAASEALRRRRTQEPEAAE